MTSGSILTYEKWLAQAKVEGRNVQTLAIPPAYRDYYGGESIELVTEHPQVAVEVRHPRYGTALVFCDEMLGSLIVELMAAGFTTVESCQEPSRFRPGQAIICFDSKQPRWRLSQRLRLAARRWQRPVPHLDWDDPIRGGAILFVDQDDIAEVVDLLQLYRRE